MGRAGRAGLPEPGTCGLGEARGRAGRHPRRAGSGSAARLGAASEPGPAGILGPPRCPQPGPAARVASPLGASGGRGTPRRGPPRSRCRARLPPPPPPLPPTSGRAPAGDRPEARAPVRAARLRPGPRFPVAAAPRAPAPLPPLRATGGGAAPAPSAAPVTGGGGARGSGGGRRLHRAAAARSRGEGGPVRGAAAASRRCLCLR